MSNLLVTPELVAAAAADLAGIGSAIGAANAAAGAPTMALLAAGADEVSAAVAAVFSSYAQQYQALSAAAAAFHDQFVRALAAGAGAYAGAEAANVEQQLLNAINAPTLALLELIQLPVIELGEVAHQPVWVNVHLHRPACGERYECGEQLAAYHDAAAVGDLACQQAGKQVVTVTLSVPTSLAQHRRGARRQIRIGVNLAVRVGRVTPISSPRFSKQNTCATPGSAVNSAVRCRHACTTSRACAGSRPANEPV